MDAHTLCRKGASGSSEMQSETWQAEESSREEESRVRAEEEGEGGGGETERATAEEAQGHSPLRRQTEKMRDGEKGGGKMWRSCLTEN